MNTKILGAFLLLVASTSGCIVVTDGSGGGTPPPPPASPGDVTFTWSFAGGTCADVPDVRTVKVTIPGESLQDDGYFPCAANNYPGIVLHDFAPGTYAFTLQGLGFNDRELFTASGNFTIDGDIRVTVDLTPAGGPNSYAYLNWRFPANDTCATAGYDGITYVDVSIDGAAFERYGCAEGFGQALATTRYLEPGTHTITLVAGDATGYTYYRYDGQLQTFAGNPISAEYFLPWDVGGAAISWQLTNGSVSQTCAQAGVQSVFVNFRDAGGNMVYGTSGQQNPCNSAPVLFQFLKPGTYQVYVSAVGSNGSYLSNAAAPPSVTVVAGEFVDGSTSLSVQLFRQ